MALACQSGFGQLPAAGAASHLWQVVLAVSAACLMGAGGGCRPDSSPSHSPGGVSREAPDQKPAAGSNAAVVAVAPKAPAAERSLEGLLSPAPMEEPAGDAIAGEHESAAVAPWPAPPHIDPERTAACGLRRLSSKHLTLYTDLPPMAAVDELPQVFDLAVPQWCLYFQIEPHRLSDWHLVGSLIKDRQRFEQAGLFPDNLPPFPHAFQRGVELWVYEQESDYYRRHLLLHEGTHAIMNCLLGGCGPPWYMEGTAELLATHRWAEGQLQLHFFPVDKSQTEMWGRIRLINEEVAARQAKTLPQVFHYGASAHVEVSPYAWCWAAATFLDAHPLAFQPFRELAAHAADRSEGFNRLFLQRLQPHWPVLQEDWQVFVLNLDYGYDLERERVVREPAAGPIPPSGASCRIEADRGWQSSGLLVEAGRRYRLEARGRFQLDDQPRIWWSEPAGVTIHYHQGHPLGMLLATAAPAQPVAGQLTPLVRPLAVGTGGEWIFPQTGTLYLRINDRPDSLFNNAGQVELQVTPVPTSGAPN